MATNFTEKNISSIELGNIKYNLKSVPFHATEAEWSEINYVPKQAEIIVYDIDDEHSYLRFKTGDGLTQAKFLPFSMTTMSEVQIYVNNQIGSAGHLKRVVLGAGQDLPNIEDAQTDTIYMKPGGYRLIEDAYDEYMVINGAWEIIGNTRVDLSNYLQEVTAGVGLTVTNKNHIEIDTEIVFVFECGTSTEII